MLFSSSLQLVVTLSLTGGVALLNCARTDSAGLLSWPAAAAVAGSTVAMLVFVSKLGAAQ